MTGTQLLKQCDKSTPVGVRGCTQRPVRILQPSGVGIVVCPAYHLAVNHNIGASLQRGIDQQQIDMQCLLCVNH